jgi:DNA-binding CsgD family transcriptional regulator
MAKPLTKGFTEREKEIMRLAAQGLSAPQIGKAIGIEGGTVRQRLKRIYRKLDVSNRVQAVNRWREIEPIPEAT